MGQNQQLLAAQYRLAQHYLDKLRMAQRMFQQGNENVAYALAMFDREKDQVKQCQAWVSTLVGQDDRATAICSDYAKASSNILHLRLLPREYLAWLEAALEAARRLGDQRAEATHLLAMYALSELTFEYHHAIHYAQQALSIARSIDDQPLMARGLNLLGNACRYEGKIEDAQAYYEQSLALYQKLNDRRGIAELNVYLGGLALLCRDHEAAQNYLEQGLAFCREIGEQEGLATSLNSLGLLAMRQEKYTAASDYMEQTLTLCRVMGNKQGTCIVLSNLGSVAYFQEDYSRARTYLEEGLDIMRAVGIREKEANCLCRLGRVTMAQGDLLKAEDYFEQSLAFRGTMETNMLSLISLSNLAIIYLLRQQKARADTALRDGLEIAASLSIARSGLTVLVAAARVWVLKGKPRQAATWLGLVENHSDPDVQTAETRRDVRVARTECLAALSPEQFATAWEEGKSLKLDAVLQGILNDLS